MNKFEKGLIAEKFTEILEELMNDLNFELFIGEQSSDNFAHFVGQCPKFSGVEFNYGMTKGVIIADDIDWVLKIPFKFQKNNTDFCREERSMYLEAKNWGIEDMFAECIYLMNWQGLDCYAMQKVEHGEDVNYERSLEYLSAEEYEEAISFDSFKYVDEILCAFYGDEKFEEYQTFCDRCGVNDVHEDNIGWVGTKPVVIDYSGFF